MPTAASYSQGKLSAHPRDPSAVTAHPKSKAPAYGLQPLGLTQSRDGLLYVPQSLAENSSRPAPLVVMLHGASGNAKGGMSYMVDLAEEVGSVFTSCWEPLCETSCWLYTELYTTMLLGYLKPESKLLSRIMRWKRTFDHAVQWQ